MKTKSFSTTTVDAYEAGIEIGNALQDIQPELIILFTSIHFDFNELFEAIYTSLGTRDVIIFGGTGDGVYETQCVTNCGVAGLAINSEKKIQWSLAIRSDANVDPYRAAQQCAQDIIKNSQNPIQLAFVFAVQYLDGVKIVEGAGSVLNIPFIGGLTGDDWQFKSGYIFVNGTVYSNAVAILGMSGDFSFTLNCASGWKPLGKTGIVDHSSGNVIAYIDGKKAIDFVEEQFGIPAAEAALGVIPLAAYESQNSEHFFLRTPSKFDMETGEITYFGSVHPGTPVRICNATEEDVVSGVNDALNGLGSLDFDPLCAVVISCGGRKWILRDRVQEEVSRIFDSLGKKIPLAGFPSFGEMSPFRNPDGSYTRSFFHNVSYVILFLGSKK